MITKINVKNGEAIGILGFGCMRLPGTAGRIDEVRSIRLIRQAIAGGINYFDTAYIYQGGQNEEVLGKALQDGYRQRVFIATKLPCYLINKKETAYKIFQTQLKRLQTDTIDYYLMHMLSDLLSFTKMRDLGVLAYLEEQKAQGHISNLGFSFHGGKKDFEDILQAYPWDFCQIQYNYMDENFQAGKSGLELAGRLGIPVIVMEPLRGGRLTDALPEAAHAIFKACDPDKTPAEWGLRWVWNHPQVNVVLSGMSNEAQLEENLKIAETAYENTLTAAELRAFDQVKQVLAESVKIPCTACGYCMPCPYGVDIPGCFSIYNDKYLLKGGGAPWKYAQALGAFSKQTAFASRCVGCGKCETHCPQQLPIRKHLQTVAGEIETPIFKGVIALGRRVLGIHKG